MLRKNIFFSCEYPCDSQHFGYNCAQRCNCDANAQCDPVSGACICSAGWTGAQCLTRKKVHIYLAYNYLRKRKFKKCSRCCVLEIKLFVT